MNVSKYWRHDLRRACSIEAETEELDERAWRWREAVIAVAGELVGWPVEEVRGGVVSGESSEGEPLTTHDSPLTPEAYDWNDAIDALDRYGSRICAANAGGETTCTKCATGGPSS